MKISATAMSEMELPRPFDTVVIATEGAVDAYDE